MSEQINFDDEIQKFLKRDPFVKFVVVLASGDRYEVTDPMQVAMGGDTVVIVHPRSGLSFFRKYQIVNVDVLEPVA